MENIPCDDGAAHTSSVPPRNKITGAAFPGLAGASQDENKDSGRKGFVMLDWLKEVLGDAYSEDIDKKVSDRIGKGFVSRSDFNEVNEEKRTLKEQVSERDKQIDGLKASSGDAEQLKTQIAKLQEDNKAAKEKYDTEMTEFKRNAMIDAELTKAGAVNVKAVKAILDMDGVDFKDGKLSGLDDKIKAAQKENAWAFPDFKADPDPNTDTHKDDGTGVQFANTGLSTGMRQGTPGEKLSGVEAEFYKRFPDLAPKDGE